MRYKADGIINNLKITANIILEFFLKNFFRPPDILSVEDTIMKIVTDKPSVSRFGDGELEIILGIDLIFQPYYEELASRLKNILRFEGENILVCLPEVFKSTDHFEPVAKAFWKDSMRRKRRKWYRYIKRDKIYYNSFISRFYLIYESKSHCSEIIRLLKLIWDERDIVIVEGEKSRLGVGNDLFNNAKSVRRILCPSVDAYRMYQSVINETIKIDKNSLILIALGPTATVMAFDLYQLGYQAIDIGHIDIEYEWYLMNAKERVAIPNKYTHEVENGREVGELLNDEYNYQVIARLS